MNCLAVNAFPEAGVWVYAFMALVACALIPVMPYIHRWRRRKYRAVLRQRVKEMRVKAGPDGKIRRGRGKYVRQKPWGVGTEARTPRSGPPRGKMYHGGEWPRNK